MDFNKLKARQRQDEISFGVRASLKAPTIKGNRDGDLPYEKIKRWQCVLDRNRIVLGLNRLGILCLSLVLIFVLGACEDLEDLVDKPTDNGQSGAYKLYESVGIQISGRSGENIQFGDYFSDMTEVWSGNRAAGDGTGFGDFRVTLPVNIEVSDSQDDTLIVKDIFGDNKFTWQRLESLSDQARRVGGVFEVDMPVLIRVSDSKRILIDVEDIFGDNSFTWTVDTTDTILDVGQIVGGVGGPFRIAMSVTIEVFDSQDVEVDVEDVFCDMNFTWNGGAQSSASFVGGSMGIEMPLTFRVERSERVRINLEDTAGDMKLNWTAGGSEVVGGPIRFDVPTNFIVVNSRDVNIDFEDQAGDNILNWVLKGQGQNPTPPQLNTPVTASTPAVFRVIDSRGVKINSEDFFGDNVFVWKGPFPQEARPGLDVAVSVWAPTTFEVKVSQDVNIDAEDVYGDNVFAWYPPNIDQASPLPASVYKVVGDVRRDVVGSDSVIIEFANLNKGNQYLWGPAPE
ncbi:hypothetical protein [Pontibacter pamirensis]|uniref:hypothetical protein n=1 Tax=Pontibacter pamirensis TaxID=2562824 RepID=UPI00138966FF|nr:hypothetical protein [Pontibacter pamirensis]